MTRDNVFYVPGQYQDDPGQFFFQLPMMTLYFFKHVYQTTCVSGEMTRSPNCVTLSCQMPGCKPINCPSNTKRDFIIIN